MTDTPQSGAKPQSTVRLGLWLTFIAFLLIILVFRNQISEIHFDTKGVSAKMMSPQDVNKMSPDERKAGEEALADRVRNLEDQAKTIPQTAAPSQAQPQIQPQNQAEPDPDAQTQFSNATYQQPTQSTIPNLAGYWTSSDGSAYQITQYGNYVLIQAYMGGVLYAAASGPIQGSQFSLQSTNLMNRPGVLSLQVSQDQRHLTGQYQDGYTGQATYVEIDR